MAETEKGRQRRNIVITAVLLAVVAATFFLISFVRHG